MWQIDYLLGTHNTLTMPHVEYILYFAKYFLYVWILSDFVGDSHKVVKGKTSMKKYD